MTTFRLLEADQTVSINELRMVLDILTISNHTCGFPVITSSATNPHPQGTVEQLTSLQRSSINSLDFSAG